MKSKFTTQELADEWGRDPRTAQRILLNEKTPYVMEGGKRVYHAKDLTSPKIQRLFLKSSQISSRIETPSLPTQGLLSSGIEKDLALDAYSNDRGFTEDLLKDARVQYCSRIVREAREVPPGWTAKKWVEHIATKWGISTATVYRFVAKEKSCGLAAHRHTKGNKGKPKLWDPRALEFGIRLALKREHRKMSAKAIYKALKAESAQQGWAVGGYRSFTLHLDKRLNPLLLAVRDGGRRALDNALPPILRSYADLQPFDIVCGDQHKFDFWVQDDDSGAIFRPEAYFFIDLRTRLIYGLWVGRRYNRFSIGLALRFGCRIFGGFKSVYTDNGRPELSNYVTDIVNEIAPLGFSVGETIDLPVDISDQDPEEAAAITSHNLRRAIVRNAKAKLIECFFHNFETLLRDEFKVSGHVKRLSASGEEQEIDDLEISKLAQAGKLLKFSEFLLTVINAANFYNQQRPHRGVLAEWVWKPRPAEATPIQCLKACYGDGWRKVYISESVSDIAFLAREGRTVDRGRIRFRTALADLYEHEALVALHGQQVSIRFDPLDPGWILVFLPNSDFVCRALPVEYSSMRDQGLAKRKIQGKARLIKRYMAEYHSLTSNIPDLTQYSTIPRLENVAQRVCAQLEEEQIRTEKLSTEPSAEQLEAEIRENEAFESRQDGSAFVEVDRPGPKRPIFEDEVERYKFTLNQIGKGIPLSPEDCTFKKEYEAAMAADVRVYWAIHMKTHGICDQAATAPAKAG